MIMGETRLRDQLLDQCHMTGYVYHARVREVLSECVGQEIMLLSDRAVSLFYPLIKKIESGVDIAVSLEGVLQAPCPDKFFRYVRTQVSGITIVDNKLYRGVRHSRESGVKVLELLLN